MSSPVTVVGLGPGAPDGCPAPNRRALRSADRAMAYGRMEIYDWLEVLVLVEPFAPEAAQVVAVPGNPVQHPGLLQTLADRTVTLMPAPPYAETSETFVGLAGAVRVVDRLLGPGGCPWDQAQTHESLKRHLVEETYEVVEAIDSGDLEKLREELGDLLLQPLLHAQMEALAGSWGSDEVAQGLIDKLVRRHPHVFGDASVADADEVLKNWDRIKQSEKGGEPRSILEGVPKSLPALLRAFEVSKRAARVGFEWPDIEAVFAKLREEEAEFLEALAGGDPSRIEAEMGDLLFTLVNVARWARVEPEDALRRMLDRFTDRFQAMEATADRPLRDLTAAEWDALWERSKASVG
ncbi:MAG: nucleoside triphosphate pyrophosphohydrolase [Fimbriimonadaceae bacterium]|nr:nucleoside triphosphate pyrophosphohydrolase [Fimbriimonadaceae bacterium]